MCNYNIHKSNTKHNKPIYKRNHVGCDGISLRCDICCSIAHFVPDCSQRHLKLKRQSRQKE